MRADEQALLSYGLLWVKTCIIGPFQVCDPVPPGSTLSVSESLRIARKVDGFDVSQA